MKEGFDLMIENYRFDMIGASLDYGVKEHPQKVMKDLGYNVVKCEPVPIGDCWWFRVSNHIDPVPPYLHRMKDDFKFSGEK